METPWQPLGGINAGVPSDETIRAAECAAGADYFTAIQEHQMENKE